MNNQPVNRWLAIAVSIVVVFETAGGGSAVLGQLQVNNGNALDANPGVNTGGYNTRIGAIDVNRQNAVITGNVSGLGYFRDEVGYFAPSEFQDSLGSSDLFRFRAQSLPPTFQGSAAAIPNQSVNAPLYRLQGTTGGNFTGGTNATSITTNRISGGFNVMTQRAYSGALSLPKSSLQGDSLFGFIARRPGEVLEVRSSPLFGVRARDTREIGLIESLRNYTAAGAEAELDDSLDPENPDDPAGFDRAQMLESIRGGMGNNPALRDAPAGWQPGLELGELMTQRIDGQRIGGESENLNDRLSEIQDGLFSPLGQFEPKPGEDVYLELLGRMANRGRPGDTTPPDQLGPLGQAGDPTNDIQPGMKTGREALLPLLEAPSDEELARAQRERDEAVARMKQLVRPPTLLPGGVTPDVTPGQLPPGIDPAGRSEGETGEEGGNATEGSGDPSTLSPLNPLGRMGPMGELMNQLDHDLPPIQSLAGDRQDRINKLLREGERRMVRGDFFAAERSYRRVLAAIPGHPMARVGLVHAQLGAGLIRSAAFSMRSLFDQHPELIATRYSRELLPSVERIKWVRGELEQMIRTTNRPEPAMMLAYLGYQMNQPDLVRYGLDLAEARQPDDALVPLLRGIWIDPQPASDAAPQDDPAQ